MSKKKTIQVELNGQTINTESVGETTAEAAAPADGEPKKTRVRKAPRAVFIAKVEGLKKLCDDLASNKYRNVGEEYSRLIDGAAENATSATIIANALPEDWKPGKGTRKNGKLAIGDFVKAREKNLDSFVEMGIGAGPFKVLGAFSSNKTVKIEIPEGSTYMPQNWVEKVAATIAE